MISRTKTFKLMIKTHDITGLKYLCKTIRDDWNSYPGSGTAWKKHLQENGKHFTTELLYETSDLETFKDIAAKKSKEFDVVNSKLWANKIPETGEDAGRPSGWKMSDEQKHAISRSRTGRKHSIETRAAIGSKHRGKIVTEETRAKMKIAKSGENHPFFGKNHSEETKMKMRKPKSEETRLKMSLARIGKKLSPETMKKIRATRELNRNIE